MAAQWQWVKPVGAWRRQYQHACASRELPVYNQDWYLDCTAPNRWCVLACVDQLGKPLAMLPVALYWRFGWRAYQPFFTQQLHWVGGEPALHREGLAWLQQHVKRGQLAVGNMAADHLPGATPRCNLVLPLSEEYSTLFQQRYTGKLRTQLRKPTTATAQPVSISEIIALFKKEKGAEVGALRSRDYRRLQNLMEACMSRQAALPLGAWVEGRLVAATFLITWQNRVYNLFAASNAEGRALGAMSTLLDAAIRRWAGTPTVLDFEGSNLPGVARFFRSFGAQDQPYFLVNW